ncbi:hypothetical protein AB833_17130 [Chromatiales bacterium (ex Bugula neritina AB1)]|nr:hypothetical protein AB833_17130 [Chromatiales bacterium (ex Bugula neritina AB1)]
MENKQSAITAALSKLLKPLARLLLRNGIAYADFAAMAKRAYVEAANEDFAVPGRKQSASRVSLLTGVHRHEVSKILKNPIEQVPMVGHRNRAARIISAWQNDDQFSDAGVARTLTIDGSFAALVAKHGADITSRAVLDELLRVGTVKCTDNEVVLLVEAFTPLGSMDDLLYILGDCTADLLETLDHNLSCEEHERRLQLSVVYNNLPDEVLPNLELVSRDRAMVFMKELNEFFATQDRDTNPGSKGKGRNRAGIGLYFFKQSIDQE